MSETLSLDLARTAVLSMDMQAGILSLYTSDGTLVSRAAELLDRCRARHLPVIHVRVGFRPGLPEVSERNALFGAIGVLRSTRSSSRARPARCIPCWGQRKATSKSLSTG